MNNKLKRLIYIALFAFSASGVYNVWGASPTGRSIMEKNDALKEPATARNKSIMIIIKGKQQEKKAFEMMSKKYGKKTRARSTFTSPTRIEFLTWSEPGEDSQQWIKLSGGTVRKIASSEKGGSFVGSHFYYEDLSANDIDDFDYELVGSKKEEGDDCYLVEARKKTGTKVYEKSVIYVRKSDYFIVRVDFYEKKGHTKTLTTSKIETIDGIITARKISMERTDGKGKSIIYITNVEYNVSIADSLLTREGL